jgi:hypothetical protein
VQHFVSRSEISSHTSSSCLVKDILLLEQPTSSLLEGVIDVCHADFPLERHIDDVSQIDDRLPCTPFHPYFGPLQHWIELACVGTCYFFSYFCIGCHVCNVISFCNYIVIEIPRYLGLIFLCNFILDHYQTQG